MFFSNSFGLTTTVIDNADFPAGIAIGALLFGRVFAKLEDLGVVHVDDQILRFFAELVDLLRLAQILKEGFLVLMVLEPFDQLLDLVLAICILLVDCRKEYARNSLVSVVVPGSPGTLRFAGRVPRRLCVYVPLILMTTVGIRFEYNPWQSWI